MYPSAALSLADGRAPQSGEPAMALLDNRPFGAETVLPDGTRTFDVTEIVELWAAGGAFPCPFSRPVVQHNLDCGQRVPIARPARIAEDEAHAAALQVSQPATATGDGLG